MRVDLDAARSARAEARRAAGAEEIVIVLGGEDFPLVSELPMEVGQLLNEDNAREAVRLLLKDPGQYLAFLAHRPSILDIEALADGYKAGSLGESSASSESSKSTTNGSRQTSDASTT